MHQYVVQLQHPNVQLLRLLLSAFRLSNEPLYRNVERLRGGLVLCHSTLTSRVIKNKKRHGRVVINRDSD